MLDQKQSVLLGALVVTFFSLPFLNLINVLCCLGVIAGAMTAVWHYTSTHRLTISAGRGAVLGLYAGALGALFAFLVNLVLAQLGLGGEAFAEFILSQLEGNVPPEQVEELRRQLGQSLTLQAQLVSAFFNLVLYAIFGAIGGAIGAAVFKKGEGEGL